MKRRWLERDGLLVVGVFWVLGATGAAAQVEFDRYEIVTGTAKHQTVLTGSFLGGTAADVAIVLVDPDGDRRLRIFALEGSGDGVQAADRSWAARVDVALSPEVLFVDVAAIGGRDRLIVYEPGRLSWFDPASATASVLTEMAAGYKRSPQGRVPHVDVTRDLNHDGRDDLILPDTDGFWTSVQRQDGSFAPAVQLGPAEPLLDAPVGRLDLDDGTGGPRARTYGDAGVTAVTLPWYLSRVHEMDYDQDGRSDLVFWSDDHFAVHRQRADGRFEPTAIRFTTEVAFDSDGAYSRMFDFSDQGVLSALLGLREKNERTVLRSLRDMNGDGVGDLVTQTLSGRGMTRQRSLYRVYPGAATPDGVVFAQDATSTVRPGGKAWGMEPFGYASGSFEDLDRDGRVDMIFRYVPVGLGGMFRALVGNSVPVDLEIHQAAEDGYDGTPTTTRAIRRFDPFAGLGNVFFPAVLLGDVSGDGRFDLLVGRGPRELQVFLGVAGPRLLDERPQKLEVALPRDERHAWLVDLDGNGRQDLLVLHAPKERDATEPHRLTTLFFR